MLVTAALMGVSLLISYINQLYKKLPEVSTKIQFFFFLNKILLHPYDSITLRKTQKICDQVVLANWNEVDWTESKGIAQGLQLWLKKKKKHSQR